MKLLTVGLLFVSGLALASAEKGDRDHKKKRGCVHGEKAEAIFNDLDVESRTKETERGTLEFKRSGPLFCVNFTNAEVDKYRCCLKKKKGKPGKGKPGKRKPDNAE